VKSDWYDISSAARREWCAANGLDITHCTEDFEVTQHVFEKLVEEKTMDPLFVTHCPKNSCARQTERAGRLVVDVYELIINGQEILRLLRTQRPDIQRARLEQQSGGETQKLDEEFLHALEYGMPPAGGSASASTAWS